MEKVFFWDKWNVFSMPLTLPLLLMFRHLPLLFSCCACLLPGACSKEESALLPGEIVLNASELPGPIMEWKLTLTSERILTINLDNPLLPWVRVCEGLQKAYARGVSDIRLRKNNTMVSAFGNGISWEIPVTPALEADLDKECVNDMDPSPPCLPDDPVLEHPFREGVSVSIKKTPSTGFSYPFVEFIQPSYSEREPYQLIHWPVRDEGSAGRRKKDVQAFAHMVNADIRQRRAFIFLVEDKVPCGEVFDYLNAIDGKDTLVGVTFSQPGVFPKRNS